VSLLPPCIEDYVGRDNPVRAIEAYVDALDLNELGFRDVGSDGGAGQPPYDPADLLKLYFYGYLHQVRSSRRLEREVRCNTEVMWLLRGLTPGYRTIANFRKDNAAGLRAASREFAGPQPGPAGRWLCSPNAPPNPSAPFFIVLLRAYRRVSRYAAVL